MNKKAKILAIFILFLGINGVFGQEIVRSQSGLKYDLRILEQTAEEHNFDVIHYEFDWDLDSGSSSIRGSAIIHGESTI